MANDSVITFGLIAGASEGAAAPLIAMAGVAPNTPGRIVSANI